MKKLLFILLTIALFLASFSQIKAQKLKSQEDSIAYAFGITLSENTAKDGIRLNPKLLYKSYKATIEGTPYFSEEAFTTMMERFGTELRGRQGKPFTDNDQPKTNLDTMSLAVGFNIAKNFQKAKMDLSGKLISKGYRDGVDAKQNRLDSATVKVLIATMQELQKEAAEEQNRIDLEKNQKEEKAFLAENKLKEGVVELPSGLQYKIEREGKGTSPTASDRVVVHYKGYLINGEVFDSSYERGEPAEFPLSGVILGWTKGLQVLKPGGKCVLYIPANLAYGDRGVRSIGPGKMLIFDVELLEVKKTE